MSTPITIAHLVRDKAQTDPSLRVLSFEHDGQLAARTYGELWNRGQRLAAGFEELGVGRGDRVGLLLQNQPEFVEAMVAAAVTGVVLVPLDPRTKGDRLVHMLAGAGCRGVIAGDYALDELSRCALRVPELRWAAVVGDHVPAERGTQQHPGLRVVDAAALFLETAGNGEIAVSDPSEPMQIMYTSGTTGDPKGIVVPHGRFMAAAGYGESVFGYRAGDRLYTGLSLTHGNAQYVTLAPAMGMGLPSIISRRFTKSRLWPVLRRHGCTVFSLLGGMATAIYSEPVTPDDRDNPVRLVISAGMPVAVWGSFRDRFKVDITEFYGAMEGGLTLNPAGVGPVGSCGRVVAGLSAKVVDAAGNEVAPGTPGELWFQAADGSPMRVEYFQDPDASARKTEGGWLRSGDIVVTDADGWIFYQHRVGGGIRHNGEFVNPALVQKALAEHPSVDDVFVYGVPAASGAPGERDVVAALVPVASAADFPAQEVFAWCRGALDPASVPTYLQIVEEIPRTASEKPQERFLLEMFQQQPEAVRTEARPVSNRR